ncbi:MAG: hypothetical protein Q9164_000939 [Protoblastenia rupestris]
MDASKTAASVGNKLQSGEEPVSGETGKGTAGKPYDQGNAEGSEGQSVEGKASAGLQDAKNKVTDAAAAAQKQA